MCVCFVIDINMLAGCFCVGYRAYRILEFSQGPKQCRQGKEGRRPFSSVCNYSFDGGWLRRLNVS